MLPPDIIFPIQRVVAALVAENFQQAAGFSFHSERVTAAELGQTLLDYPGPGRLTTPPLSAYQDIEVYEYDDGSGAMLEFFLWADGEPSDLQIKIDATCSDGEWYYTLWDIHVP